MYTSDVVTVCIIIVERNQVKIREREKKNEINSNNIRKIESVWTEV